MTEVNGATRQRHFSVDEEAALKRDESTSSIVKRDTKSNVDIWGSDRTWPETKHHQQGVGHNAAPLIAEGGVTAFEAAEITGVVTKIEHMLAATRAAHAAEGGAAIAGGAAPLVAFGAGVYGLAEAHVHGAEQARALAKDNAHVALIAVLDLPESYKAARFDGDYKHVARGPNSPAFRAAEGLMKDRAGLAALQLHADRGMMAARDLLASGMAAAAFIKLHPEVGQAFMKDAAFREGFQAYLHAKATMTPDQMKAFEQRLDQRDGWYAQSQIQLRG